jgi:hypothetical protein
MFLRDVGSYKSHSESHSGRLHSSDLNNIFSVVSKLFKQIVTDPIAADSEVHNNDFQNRNAKVNEANWSLKSIASSSS